MESSIRKNWFVAVCLGVFAAFIIAAVADCLSNFHRGRILKQTRNDLKWIVLALHAYHGTHGSFPPAVSRNDNGDAIHSWRSLIHRELADVVETDDRFDSYTLSQPWDSPHNEQSIRTHRFGKHPYQILAVAGPNAAWGVDRARSLSDFTDGTGTTILLIAIRDTGTKWHQPIDAQVDGTGRLSLNNQKLDTSNDLFVVMADGTVTYRAIGIQADTLPALLTINAGDTVDDNW